MAITNVQLAAALRLGDGVTALVEPELGIVNRLLAVAVASVTAYAGDAPPDDVADEAAIRFAAYLYDAPGAGANADYAAAFRNSGAAALLAPWRTIGAGVVGATIGAGVSAEVAAAVTSILQLADTPDSFAGQSGKVLGVNDEANALVFVDGGINPDALADVSNVEGTISFFRESGEVKVIDIPVYSNAQADQRVQAYTQPFTVALRDKLAGIADGAQVNRTPQEIVAALGTLTGNDRLDAQTLRNRPLTQVEINSLIAAYQRAFTALSDTPSALGTAGQFVAVNSAASALEFVDAPTGGGGGGQTEAQVEALIKSGVKDYAETDGRKIAADDMNTKGEEVLGAFEGDAWATGGAISPPQSSAPTSVSAPTAGYAATRTQSPRVQNYYIAVRIPVAEKENLSNWRLVVGADVSNGYRAVYPASGWTHLVDSGGNAYYTTPQIPDIPEADEVEAQTFTPLTLAASVGLPGVQPYARTGSKAQIPLSQIPHAAGVEIVHDAAGTGFNIQATNLTTNPTALRDFLFDLDDYTPAAGEANWLIELTISGESDALLSWDADSVIKSKVFSGVSFLDVLAALDAYNTSDAPGTGLLVDTGTLYLSTSRQMEIDIYFGRNANNQVAPSFDPNPFAGNNSLTITPTRIEVGVSRSNSASGGASTFAALTDTPSSYSGQGGKHLAVNSGADAVEFVDAPGGLSLSSATEASITFTGNDAPFIATGYTPPSGATFIVVSASLSALIGQAAQFIVKSEFDALPAETVGQRANLTNNTINLAFVHATQVYIGRRSTGEILIARNTPGTFTFRFYSL